MLAFITSVRHPQNSRDYAAVEQLLRRTLQSICQQDDGDYRVVVVCNEVPSGDFPATVQFVQVDFPPPSAEAGPQTGREAVLLDKGTKLAVALVAAQKHRPSHVMKVDADDFVSRRLAGVVRSGGPGWVVDRGYMVSASTGLIALVEDFNRKCGTSEIIANELFGLPAVLPPLTASQDELTEVLGSFLVRDLLGSHRVSVAHFRSLGFPLVPLPFRGAVYAVATGENHSGKAAVPRGRPIDRATADEFALDHLRTPRAWLHLAAQRGRTGLGKARRGLVRR